MSFHVPTPVRRQRVVEQLREQRLSEGKTLDDLSDEIRVPVPVLRDLEQLREDRLPTDLVVKGFAVAGDYAFGNYTHEKNPVTARAALETLTIIDDEDLVANAARVGATRGDAGPSLAPAPVARAGPARRRCVVAVLGLRGASARDDRVDGDGRGRRGVMRDARLSPPR